MEDKGGIENSEGTPDPKERDPPTSRKQMRKLGEPARKVQRRSNDPEEEIMQDPEADNSASRSGKDGVHPRHAKASKQEPKNERNENRGQRKGRSVKKTRKRRGKTQKIR